MNRPQACGELGRLAVESDGGPASGLTGDFNIAPANAVAPTGAESLHAGFFGGEAGRVALHAVGLGVAIANLAFGEHAVEEAGAMARQRVRDARNLRNVDPGADNQERLR